MGRRRGPTEVGLRLRPRQLACGTGRSPRRSLRRHDRRRHGPIGRGVLLRLDRLALPTARH